MKKKIILKYRLKELLGRIAVAQSASFRKSLLKYVDITAPTLDRWQNIKADESQDIPYGKLKKLAEMFEVEIGEMETLVSSK